MGAAIARKLHTDGRRVLLTDIDTVGVASQLADLDPAEVFRMATESPARAIGVSSDRGRVAPGLAADLVVWDDELRPVHVIRGGRLVR